MPLFRRMLSAKRAAVGLAGSCGFTGVVEGGNSDAQSFGSSAAAGSRMTGLTGSILEVSGLAGFPISMSTANFSWGTISGQFEKRLSEPEARRGDTTTAMRKCGPPAAV
jgi:hypothetical protein